MKIAGVKIEGPNVETIIIPRGNGEDVVFKARAILDFSNFEALCPDPKPPFKIMRGGKKVRDIDAPSYKESQERYAQKRIAWMVISSLDATEDLEWDTVDIDDQNTWLNFEPELKGAGFSIIEIHRIVNGVLAANCLDEAKLEKARESFLALQRQATDPSFSPVDEASDMPSGEPASDSE